MTTRRAFLNPVTIILVLSLAVTGATQSREPIPVVATFSILGDMAKRIGGEHVDVTTLVGPDGDTHVYRPTPADARSVSEAQIIVVNGLQFEGWLVRLIDASEFHGVRVVATDGIEPIADEHGADGKHAEDDDHKTHDHGTFDPHAWQSLRHAMVYVENITAALSKVDPGNASAFYRNREAYVDELEALDVEIRKMVAKLPADSRTVVTSHDAFRYFGRDYGLTFIAPQGLSTESEASAQDVARLVQQIRDRGIRAVFIENVADPRLLERIADETGAAIGGTLYPGALSSSDGPASTYLDMMRHNATTITQALTL